MIAKFCLRVGVVVAVIAAQLGTARGQGLSAGNLATIKAATVFIQVGKPGGAGATGSGFLVRVDGDTGYIVTNNHVIDVSDLMGDNTAAVPIRVVFNSGTPTERTAPARVVAALEQPDLAVLKVEKMKDLPKPLDLSDPPKLMETSTVYVCGFPFGAKLASADKNPEISIGTATVSSIRTDKSGLVTNVQLNGALNPGNSGGPVVAPDGKLVGVAVKTVRNAGIGLAIPQHEVATLLRGRTGKMLLLPKSNAPSEGEIPATIQVELLDPFSNIKSIAGYYMPVRPNVVAPELVAPGILPGLMKIPLKVIDGKATAEVMLPNAMTGAIILQLELDYTNRKIYTIPVTIGLGDDRMAPKGPGFRPSANGKLKLPSGIELPFPSDTRPAKSDGTDISEINRTPEAYLDKLVKLDAISPCSTSETGGLYELYVETEAGNAPSNLRLTISKDLALQVQDLGVQEFLPNPVAQLKFAVRVVGKVKKPIGRDARHIIEIEELSFLNEDATLSPTLKSETSAPGGKPTLSLVNRFPDKYRGQILTLNGALMGVRTAGKGYGVELGNENNAKPLNLDIFVSKEMFALVDSDVPKELLRSPAKVTIVVETVDPRSGHGFIGVTKIELLDESGKIVKTLNSTGKIDYPAVQAAIVKPTERTAEKAVAPTDAKPVVMPPKDTSLMIGVGVGAAVIFLAGGGVLFYILKKASKAKADNDEYITEDRPKPKAKPPSAKPKPTKTDDNPFENF